MNNILFFYIFDDNYLWGSCLRDDFFMEVMLSLLRLLVFNLVRDENENFSDRILKLNGSGGGGGGGKNEDLWV